MAAEEGTPVLAQDLVQLAAQIQLQLSQVEFQLVEEGTRMAPGSTMECPLNTDDTAVPVEHESTSNEPQAIHSEHELNSTEHVITALAQESTSNTQKLFIMAVEEESASNEPEIIPMEQESPCNEPEVISGGQQSTSNESGFAGKGTEQGETVTYEVLHQGTRRGRAKLIDSNGYTYNKKFESPKVIYWQCTVRSKVKHCKSTVIQRGDVFQMGLHGHNHEPKVAAMATGRIAALVKEKAQTNLLKPAPAIVNEVLQAEFASGAPLPSTVKPEYLARIANRARQFARSRGLQNLAFEVNEDLIPEGFFRGDILKQGKRHLIFATEEQLRLLRKAKSWYIDQAFQHCPEKFEQLFTISAFVSSEDKDAKQVPLVFVLMSSSEKKDYRKVLKKILDILPTAPAVRQITVFYEQTLWSVLNRVLPDATVKGCVYHWTQVAWKTIQELGLQSAYSSDRETNLFLRKVMALPFLPQEEIQPMFVRLWVQAATAPLQFFIQYLSTAWIYNTTWPPSLWSVFSSVVRTTKDVEGWNESLSVKTIKKGRSPAIKNQPNLYVVLGILYKEASNLTSQTKALSDKKLLKIRNQKPRSMQAKFFQNWEDFKNQKKSAAQLLNACADVSGLISGSC